jgi:DNA repair exonuclease SbcCD ATPase subunit
MSFKLKTLTVKNFMSVGNQTQAVHLDRDDLTLVLGENFDTGGSDGGARNGTGKTTIINALSYALYGIALTNIKRDNLINKTNGKGMLVTVEFEKEGLHYRIERGRKPNVLKFYINEYEQESEDSAQGDSRETQAEIEKLLGMSHNMFKHIVALNTYTEPFLSMRANDQREIIEQLLGITQLSEKADNLKELIKETKNSIKEEEYRIKAIEDANSRIQDQIENLKRRQRIWQKKNADDIEELESGIGQLSHINIEQELENHASIAEYNEKKQRLDEAVRWLDSINKDSEKQQTLIEKLDKEIVLLKEHKCYACGQEMHDEKQESILESKQSQKQDALEHLEKNQTQAEEYSSIIEEFKDLGELPSIFYSSINEAYEHQNTISALETQLSSKKQEVDPYTDQIHEMENEALQEITWDVINDLTDLQKHQEFLYKLLTNKDSFIRKRIIDQNLAYLNTRLEYYLNNVGLPHQVKFQNDLSVEIQELGRDLDFDNLSRGERNRLILSLSWAFRDVWESLYQPINLLFIDELVDSGMDSNGVENSMSILKKMSRNRNKSVWLVSHKDELIGRVNNVLKVIKENGFTSYNTDVETV